MGITVNFWHVADAGKDSVDLLDGLIEQYGAGPNYIIVKKFRPRLRFLRTRCLRGLRRPRGTGRRVISVPQLHESSMRKIDRQNTSFWAAINLRDRPEALGLLERQRVKTWLKNTYAAFDELPL